MSGEGSIRFRELANEPQTKARALRSRAARTRLPVTRE